jgi:hypothetical protein
MPAVRHDSDGTAVPSHGQDRNAINADDSGSLRAKRGQRHDVARVRGDRKGATGPEDLPGNGRQPRHEGVGRGLERVGKSEQAPRLGPRMTPPYPQQKGSIGQCDRA